MSFVKLAFSLRPRRAPLAAGALLLALAPFAFSALAGCGGGGGGSAVSSAAALTRSAALDVYVTDAFSDNYRQVLVTLYKIELTTDKTTYQTVFTSEAGQTLNLSSLADTAELLASLNLPEGAYTEARITVGESLTLVSKSGASEQKTVDAEAGVVSNGQVTVSVPTRTTVKQGASATLLVDFKLASFALTGKGVRPAIVTGGEAECAGKARRGHLAGTVTNFVDGVGFDLQGRGERVIKVTLGDATVVTNAASGEAATLANGLTVLVEGPLDAATKTVAATAVTVGDLDKGGPGPNGERLNRVRGTVATIDAGGQTLTLMVDRADGFTPTGGTITVKATDATKFPRGSRAAFSLSDVTVGSEIHAGGAFDAATQTLTARVIGRALTGAQPGDAK